MHFRDLMPAFVLSVFGGTRGRERRRLDQLRRIWGKEIARERDPAIVSLYHASVRDDRQRVDDQTWQDLGLEELFGKIDRTAGNPGRQVLYHQLRTYVEDDAVLAERARQQDIFQRETGLRERCQTLLMRLDAVDDRWLAALLLNPFPALPAFAPLIYVCSLTSLVCLAGIAFRHFLILPAMILLLVNTVITASYGRRIRPYFTGFSQVVTMSV